MREVVHTAIEQLQKEFLSAEEVAASHAVMGLDSQLVEDGTYFVVEDNGVLAGCGGWSRRATLYGGDHSAELRDPRLLDRLQGGLVVELPRWTGGAAGSAKRCSNGAGKV